MSTAPIIAVTGTKGKTTTVAVISDVLQKLGKNTLRVDTTGHFLNGKRMSTLDDSRSSWGLVPSVCPGRFLWEFHDKPELDDKVAVLECSLGCSGLSGLGYRNHDVGVFLNVFEDHLGSSARLKTKEDIAIAKSFIFERIREGGYAVFNVDDPLVSSRLQCIQNEDVHLIPVGIDFTYFDVKNHLSQGGVAITLVKNMIVLLKQGESVALVNINKLPWTFDGNYKPSVYNLLHIVGALYGYFNGKLPDNFGSTLESVRLDPLGGRLTVLRASNGATLIADYAHEKVSLAMVAELGRNYVKPGGKLTGVVRLAYDRTSKIIEETGEVVAKHFDEIVVYDKIDGHFKQPKKIQSSLFKQEIGYTSGEFTKAIKMHNDKVTQIIREDEALGHVAKNLDPNDVVVVIVNDDIERSIGFIQNIFNAEFI